MGSTVSRSQLNEYREVVKGRMDDEAISFLHAKYIAAAPEGRMDALQFKRYIEKTGVYKHHSVAAHQRQAVRQNVGRGGGADGSAWASPAAWFGGSSGGAQSPPAAAAVEGAEELSDAAAADLDGDDDMYTHLFRGYDLDGDGVVTFKEFLIYHLAVVYSTDDLFNVVFNTYDADGDGYLSLGDIKVVITASTRYVSDYSVRDREVVRVIDEEARRLMAFLDIRRQGRVQREDMRLIAQRYPQVLEKMKCLM